ncbi:MAG: hypothetical protein ONB46_06790 [candidate division KSB1 bacterium]|nr:hypothetical protein [candidate division KSB1 bacterium]
MTVEFICPHCSVEQKTDWTPESGLSCRACHVNLSHFTSAKTHIVERCAVCAHDKFYLQKDFNPRLGLFIFALGVIFSYHTKFISLFVATAIDFILYYIISTVTICYQCRAIYRGFKENPAHQGYNHVHALKYVPKPKEEKI